MGEEVLTAGMKEINSEYLDKEEVAKFMGISVKTLQNRISEGKNHPPVIKSLNKFRKKALIDWLNKQEQKEVRQAS